MPTLESRFTFVQSFEIRQDGEPFFDATLRYHNLDRQRMLVLENTTVDYIVAQNALEQPAARSDDV